MDNKNETKTIAALFLFLINIILTININYQMHLIREEVKEYYKSQSENELNLTLSMNITVSENVSANTVSEDEIIVAERSLYADTIDGLTDYEKDLICRIAWLEAGNQPMEGKRAVVEVILNRLMDPIWPSTIEGVLSAPNQFSTQYIRGRVSQDQIDQMMLVIDEVYVNEPVLPQEYVYFNSLTNPRINNPVKIQDHQFGTR